MVIKKPNFHSTQFTFNQLKILLMTSSIGRVFAINANSVSFFVWDKLQIDIRAKQSPNNN